MKTNHQVGLLAACIGSAVLGFPQAHAILFSDGFEDTALDPFWSTMQQSGSIVVPSTAKPHTGGQSAQFNTTSTGVQKEVRLIHTFPTLQEGELSVWVWDVGADLARSNYLWLETSDSAAADRRMHIYAANYDQPFLGGGMTYEYYVAPLHGYSLVDRTASWHEFRILGRPGEQKLWVDGVLVYSGTGDGTFDTVQIGMQGAGYDQAMTAYFDDFQISTTPVPEPRLYGLLAGLSLAGFAVLRRFRTQRV